jgi:hypothetical protein
MEKFEKMLANKLKAETQTPEIQNIINLEHDKEV